MGEVGARALRAVTAFNHGVFLFKVAAWTIFALIGPAASLLSRNFVGGAVTGGISILLGALLFRDSAWSFRGRKSLRIFLLVQGVTVAGYSAYRLTAPPPGWDQENGASRPTLWLGPDGRVRAVEFSEQARVLERDPATGAWAWEAFPGGLAMHIAFDAASRTVVVAENRRPVLWLRDAVARSEQADQAGGSAWRSMISGHPIAAIASSGGAILVAGGGKLSRLALPSGVAADVPGLGRVKTVCAAGPRVLAVQSAPPGSNGRAWESVDAGATFRDEPSFRGPGALCAVDRAGWAWVAEGGMLSGDLAVREPGGRFVTLDPPLSRIESLVIDESNGREGWVGGWGGGVFRSRDGGRTWIEMGLDGFEVSSIAVDFARKKVFAATGSGVYARSFSP